MTVSPARKLAFEILLKVGDGGYASDLLAARSAGLDARDAGLAHELVFGSLRYQGQLDYLIGHYSGRAQRLDPEVRVALRLGIYQIRYLERIPKHAAVSESVELVKQARKRSAAGFVNAVLRKTNPNPVEWPSREARLSCPEWLIARWEQQFGREVAEGVAEAALKQPETYIRLPLGATPKPEQNEPKWGRPSACGGAPPRPAGWEPAAGQGPAPQGEVPGAFVLTEGPVPPGARIQDIGSQSIVPLLDLAPGQTFLDLCAAPGNKTAHALESGVDAVACDLHLSRLRHVERCRRVVLDASQPLPFAGTFDRILVDAPCSGTGTLARNPEIKWRIEPTNITQLAELQRCILANALRHVRPGGRLVYSTCSLENEENQEVVSAVLREGVNARILHTMQRIPGRNPGDGFYACVLALN